ncbi:MAG TPA: YcxB family protein [Gemmatimonadales bacterium]|nr:YcxB family protein [Gemmatimonadales bacterium]
MTIDVRGQPTAQDHWDALQVVQRRLGYRWVAPTLCVGGPALLVLVSLVSGRSFQHALFVNVFWIVLGGLILIAMPLTHRRNLRALLRGNPDATAPVLYRFTDRGFEERECPVEVSIAWPEIREAVETATVLLLFVGRTRAFIVPRRALEQADQLDSVRVLLHDRLGARARRVGSPSHVPPSAGRRTSS